MFWFWNLMPELDTEEPGGGGEPVEPENPENPEEPVEPEEPKEPGEPEEPEKPKDPEVEDVLDWQELIADKDIPDEAKESPEALLDWAANLKGGLADMKKYQTGASKLSVVDSMLKAQGYAGGVEDFLEGKKPGASPGEGQQEYFAVDTFNKLKNSGQISEDYADDHLNFAKNLDVYLAPRDRFFASQFQKIMDLLETTGNTNKELISFRDDAEYGRYVNSVKSKKQKPFSVEKIQEVRKKFPGISPIDAHNWLLLKNPNFIEQVVKNTQNKGPGGKLRVMRPGKRGTSRAVDVKAYIKADNTIDYDKLKKDFPGVTNKKRKEIIDQIAAMARAS